MAFLLIKIKYIFSFLSNTRIFGDSSVLLKKHIIPYICIKCNAMYQ